MDHTDDTSSVDENLVWSDEEEVRSETDIAESFVPTNTLLIKESMDTTEDIIQEKLGEFGIIDLKTFVSLNFFELVTLLTIKSDQSTYKAVFRDEEDATNALEYARQLFGEQAAVYPL